MPGIMPYVSVGSARMHYEESGSGPAVVFVHGWAASCAFFRSTMARIGPSHRCITLCWKGMGDSDKPADAAYTVDEYVEELREATDRLGLARFVLVGHSMGGMISAAFSARYPNRVQGLVLVNAPLAGHDSFFWRVRLLLVPVLNFLIWLLAHLRWVRRIGARDFTHGFRLDDWVIDDVRKATFTSLMRSVRSMATTDLTDRLGAIRAPTLVVSSDHDRIVRAGQFALARRCIPGAESCELSPVGHCPMLEAPNRFDPAVAAFVARCDPAGGPASIDAPLPADAAAPPSSS